MSCEIQKCLFSALPIEASFPPQDLEEDMGLSPDARASAEEREMRPALRGEGGVRGWGMLCEGQATHFCCSPCHVKFRNVCSLLSE